MGQPAPRDAEAGKSWTFLTNHARVLVRIARDPHLRVREIADLTGITERTALQIVADLEEAGYLTRFRVGRRNSYTIAVHAPLRHPADAGHDIQALISVFTDQDRQRDVAETGPHRAVPR